MLEKRNKDDKLSCAQAQLNESFYGNRRQNSVIFNIAAWRAGHFRVLAMLLGGI